MASKMENASDTETDDELYEHPDLPPAHTEDAPALPPARALALEPKKAADSAALVAEPLRTTETVATQRGDQATADSKATLITGQVAQSVEMAQEDSQAPLVGNVDSESTRMVATPAPEAAASEAPTTNSPTLDAVKADVHPPLDIFEPKPLVPEHNETSTAAADVVAQVAVKQDQQIYEGPPPPVHIPVASTTKPLRTLVLVGPPVVIPTNTQFKSPFSSLATQYQSPAPPVVGAPPVYGGPPTSTQPIPPMEHKPTVPCDVCCKILPENASPVRLNGHGVCSCCGCYYPSLVIRQNHPFCSSCAPDVPAPSRPVDPSPSSATSSRQSVCFECKKAVNYAPPTDGKGLDCKCCLMWYDVSNFSKPQRYSKLRRCRSCVAGPHTPLKFVKKPKHPQYAADKQRHREKVMQRREERLNGEGKSKKKNQADGAAVSPMPLATPSSASTQQASASGQPPEVSQATPQERQEMEVDVRNIKLARRSIHRRRRANDLRGSTRLEYEMQLSQEEDKLNQKMNRMRRRNPALFDWFNQGLEIKGALGIAPRDWDHPLKGKKHQQKHQSNHIQKRKDSGGAKESTSQAKRPRVADPSLTPAHIRFTDTRPVKSDVKGESSSAVSARSEAPRAVATRARRAKPIEIIDLSDY